MQRNEAETQTDLCDKVGQGGTHYPLVFQSGELIHSGGTVTLKTHPNTIFGVTRIFHKGTGIVARGELVINSSIDRDVEITAPVQKLQCVKVPLTKKDKDHLSKFNIADNSELQRSLLDAPPEVREQVRASQLGAAVAREVHFALKSKNAKRRFCLGLCSFEHDLSILGFGSARKVVFSYRESNISKLDSLLGQQWDVFSFDANQFKFVTQVVFRLREQIISGTIYTSVSRSELTPSYRQCLADTDLAVPVIEEDENSDQEEV